MADKPLIASITYSSLVRLIVLELVVQRGETVETATRAVEGMQPRALSDWAKELGHQGIKLTPSGFSNQEIPGSRSETPMARSNTSTAASNNWMADRCRMRG